MGCKLSVPSVSPIMTLRGNRQDNLGIWRVFHPRTGHWYCCKYQNLFGLTLWVPAHTICSGMDSNHADREEKAEGEPGFTCSSCSHYVRDCPSCGQELPSLQTVRLFGSSHFKHYSWLADPWAFMPSQPWRPHQSETRVIESRVNFWPTVSLCRRSFMLEEDSGKVKLMDQEGRHWKGRSPGSRQTRQTYVTYAKP